MQPNEIMHHVIQMLQNFRTISITSCTSTFTPKHLWYSLWHTSLLIIPLAMHPLLSIIWPHYKSVLASMLGIVVCAISSRNSYRLVLKISLLSSQIKFMWANTSWYYSQERPSIHLLVVIILIQPVPACDFMAGSTGAWYLLARW